MAQVKGLSLGGLGSPCCCAGGGGVPCSPCNIPASDGTVSWSNFVFGNGSIPIVYNGVTMWVSGCDIAGTQYTLLCTGGGLIEFRAQYWTSGACPGAGTTNYCSNTRTTPLGLTRTSFTCSPFSMTFTLTAIQCPGLGNVGYTDFTVTFP